MTRNHRVTQWAGNVFRDNLEVYTQCVKLLSNNQHFVMPPLFHVKRPMLFGVSQALAVSQTGYMTRQGSD